MKEKKKWKKKIIRFCLFNGSPKVFSRCSRGVRQRDFLSLHLRRSWVWSYGFLYYSGLISHPQGCYSPTHVLYVDDIFIFSRGDSRSLSNLFGFLNDYGDTSSRKISKGKSVFFSVNLPLSRIVGIKIYLGVLTFHGASSTFRLRPIADGLRVRIASWKGRILSFAGRIHLMKSILELSLMHSFRVYNSSS